MFGAGGPNVSGQSKNNEALEHNIFFEGGMNES